MGLREQLERTIAAARRLVTAHVDLAKAELAVILADVARFAGLVAMAIALVLYVLLLVSVGSALFLGEWIFGSMGWGILHGTLFCLATAFMLILVALRIRSRYLAGALLVAVLLGVAAGVVLAYSWPNAAYARIGESVVPSLDAGIRPLVVGLTLWGTVLAILGLLLGAWRGGVGGALGGFLAGAVLGVLFGAFTAITFDFEVGVAIGVTVTLVTWPILAALALRDFDAESLKARFTPQASIDAAKETQAFVEARLPFRREDEG